MSIVNKIRGIFSGDSSAAADDHSGHDHSGHDHTHEPAAPAPPEPADASSNGGEDQPA